MNANILNTQIKYKIKYDPRGYWWSHKVIFHFVKRLIFFVIFCKTFWPHDILDLRSYGQLLYMLFRCLDKRDTSIPIIYKWEKRKHDYTYVFFSLNFYIFCKDDVLLILIGIFCGSNSSLKRYFRIDQQIARHLCTLANVFTTPFPSINS